MNDREAWITAGLLILAAIVLSGCAQAEKRADACLCITEKCDKSISASGSAALEATLLQPRGRTE